MRWSNGICENFLFMTWALQTEASMEGEWLLVIAGFHVNTLSVEAPDGSSRWTKTSVKSQGACRSPPQDTYLDSWGRALAQPHWSHLVTSAFKIRPPCVVPSTHREMEATSLLIEKPQVMAPSIFFWKGLISLELELKAFVFAKELGPL